VPDTLAYLIPSAEFPFHVALNVVLFYVGSFVVLFFAFAKAQLNFDPSLFEIKRKGNKRITLFFGFPRNALYFVTV
jgi:hypothetical protein